MAGLYSSWQLGRPRPSWILGEGQLGRGTGPAGEGVQSAGRAGRRGCTVGWPGIRAGHQLARGTGPGWDQLGWVAPLVRRAVVTPTAWLWG